MSEAEKDTREWTIEGVLAGSVEDQGLKLDTVLVPKSALTAALEERDERLTLAESGTLARLYSEHKDRAERAEAALAEALDVIAGIVLPVERLRSHQEQIDGKLAREDAAVFLGKHGRLPS